MNPTPRRRRTDLKAYVYLAVFGDDRRSETDGGENPERPTDAEPSE
jgi:hypothetical protein